MKDLNAKIVASLKKGDNDKALKTLYKKVFPKVKTYIRSNSGNDDEAFDIFQDAMVILCRQIKTGRYDASKEVAGFLYHVSRNLWINKAKHDKRMVRITGDFESTASEDFTNEIITPEKAIIIKKVIERLGEKCFQLLQYSIYEELPYTEICRIMGFATSKAVKTQKYKCKQKLFKLMEEMPIVKEVLE